MRSSSRCGSRNTGRRWYLVAWDLDREDWRTFRVDRVQQVAGTGSQFVPRKFPGDIVGLRFSNPFDTGRTRIACAAGSKARTTCSRNRCRPWCGKLEQLDDGHCSLDMSADSIEMLVTLMVMTGMEFEMLDAQRAEAGDAQGARQADESLSGRKGPGVSRP